MDISPAVVLRKEQVKAFDRKTPCSVEISSWMCPECFTISAHSLLRRDVIQDGEVEVVYPG